MPTKEPVSAEELDTRWLALHTAINGLKEAVQSYGGALRMTATATFPKDRKPPGRYLEHLSVDTRKAKR
jgi:hypothetical protein